MHKYFKVAMSWLCVMLVFAGVIPTNLFVKSAVAASGELIWPNPGAINLTKAAAPAGEQGKWNITLTVEGKNIRTTSDVVLLIDKSSSMSDGGRMESAKTAAKKFVDQLLIQNSTTRIALVSFGSSSETVSPFKGVDQKSALTSAINGISAGNYSGNIQYTNIQSGLHAAGGLLDGSTADNKVIVLLSDGAPTRSYKAASAQSYSWPSNKYNFRLSNFNYSSVLGSNANFTISSPYKVNNFTVSDNGIPTLSEAKMVQEKGYGIYSIGLEVGNDQNAQYVLNNVQNRGYYASTSSELNKVFTELSSKISYAAQAAKVIDPMGGMFNLVGSPVVSQGEIQWDAAKETFTWTIGNVIEGAPATLTYTVQMDQSKKPDPNMLYPTNGKTTISYTDVNGKPSSKDFEVPQVSFGKGSIKVKGYHVNAAGKPVNADGVVVDRPDQAEQLFNDPFTQNGHDSLDIGKTYAVTAKSLNGYQLKTGVSPTNVTLTLQEPTQTVWFGYTTAPNKLKVEYLAGDTVLEQAQELSKVQGEAVDFSAKTFEGYQLKDVKLSSGSGLTVDGGHVTGSMPNKVVTITFNYEAAPQKVTVKYVERGTDKPLTEVQTFAGVTNQEMTLKPVDVPGYTPEESSHAYKFTASSTQEFVFYYTAAKQSVTVKYLEQGSDKVLADAKTVEGTTGGTTALTAAAVPGYTAVQTGQDYIFTADSKQEFIFYYTANKQTVTVKYLEKDTNKVLAEPGSVEGATGKETQLSAKPVAGYTAVESIHAYTFTTDNKQEYVFYYTANEQTVSVKYLDAESKEELAARTEMKGKTGETVDVTALPIPGYTPTKTSDTYTVIGTGPNEYVFYYTADGQSVTVKYVDKDSKAELADPTAVEGKTGATVNLKALVIPGYTPVKTADTYKIIGGAANEYVFYYTANEQTVTVKYVEQGTGKTLFTPTKHTGKTGQILELTAAPIAGYTPVQTKDTYQVKAEGSNEYVFYYTADEQQITVKYLEEGTGKELFTPTKHTGKTGQILDLTAAPLPGYTATKTSDQYTVKGEGSNEYTFYYTADQQTVTVKYLEQSTENVLSAETTLTGKTGDKVDVSAAVIPGYTPAKDSDQYEIAGAGPQVYVFYYTANTYNLTVKYLEQGTDKELFTPTSQTGRTGQTVELKAAELPGYTPVKAEDTYSFTPDGSLVYVFYYTADEQIVTVKYQEQDTKKELAPDGSVTGKTGATVEVQAAAVAGYTPVKLTDTYSISGKGPHEYVFYYTAKDQTVTVKYLEEGTGAKLAEPTAQTGKTGQTVVLTAAEVAGYTAKSSSYSYEIQGGGPQEYVFYYTASPQTVLVKYLEKETNKVLLEAKPVEGATGQTVELQAEMIEGYTPAESVHAYTFTADEVQVYMFYYTADPQTVTVKYVDQKSGEELAKPTAANGTIGEVVKLTAIPVAGYTPSEAEHSYTFTGKEGQEYVFTYTADPQQVTVKYLEQGTNQPLSDTRSFAGVTDEELLLEAAAVEGYTPVDAAYAYTFTADKTQEHIFYYTADKQTLTVKYLEQGTDKELASAVTEEGIIGKAVELTAAPVKGYTPVDETSAYTFTAGSNQVYVFYYNAKPLTLTVKYVDKATEQELSDPTTHEGVIGLDVTLTAVQVPGYTAEEPTYSYVFTGDETEEYVFYYTADAQTVTVKYLEKGSAKPLAEASTVKGFTGGETLLTPADIEGYAPEEEAYTYLFTSDEYQEYVFYYTAQEQTLTVKYLDKETGNELAESTQVTGAYGESINLDAVQVPGYSPEEASYTYTFNADRGQEHIFYYLPSEQQVTVKYLDKETGAILSNESSQQGNTGEEVLLTAVEVAGYTPEEPTFSYTFTAEESQQHVFYYTADDQAVTVKYVERETNIPLKEESVVSGKTNQTLELTAAEVPGYTPAQSVYSYTFTAEEVQVYVFYYTKDVQQPVERTVTVNYVYADPANETVIPLAEPDVMTGTVGDVLHLTAGPLTVADVVYSPTLYNFDYEITDAENQQYTFYYESNPAGDLLQLLVTFIDRATGAELGSGTYQGHENETIDIKAQPITVADAVYNPEQTSYSYTFNGEPNQEFQIYYTLGTETPPVDEDQELTVRYLRQGTNAVLADPTVWTGKPGETLALTAPAVSGYTAVNPTYSYTFTSAEGQEYIFYYTRNSTTVVSPPSDNNVTPLPPAPPVTPLPPAPPTLDKDNHYNYIFGYPDGMVKPLNNISREEVAAIFYRLMDDATRSDYMVEDSSFSDVGDTRWSNKAIGTMQKAGIITGYLDGAFKPGQAITRAEFAAIASRFDELDGMANDRFSDVSGHWAEKYIVSAANKGWIKGYPDGTFKPDQYITRAEAMAFINSVLNRNVNEEGIHEDAKMWPDNTPDKWYYEAVLEATNNHDYNRNEDGETEAWTEVKPAHLYP